MAKFLDDKGVSTLWRKIKSVFATKSDLSTTNKNVTTANNHANEALSTANSASTTASNANAKAQQAINQINSVNQDKITKDDLVFSLNGSTLTITKRY